jgi:hypothetical protein
MIEKFAGVRGDRPSEFLDYHASKLIILVSPLIPKFAQDAGFDV